MLNFVRPLVQLTSFIVACTFGAPAHAQGWFISIDASANPPVIFPSPGTMAPFVPNAETSAFGSTVDVMVQGTCPTWGLVIIWVNQRLTYKGVWVDPTGTVPPPADNTLRCQWNGRVATRAVGYKEDGTLCRASAHGSADLWVALVNVLGSDTDLIDEMNASAGGVIQDKNERDDKGRIDRALTGGTWSVDYENFAFCSAGGQHTGFGGATALWKAGTGAYPLKGPITSEPGVEDLSEFVFDILP